MPCMVCYLIFKAKSIHAYPHFVGERNILPNVHSLLHLPEAVKDLGPLWAHSCFPYESANGDLLKLYHGSQSVEKQVSYTLT